MRLLALLAVISLGNPICARAGTDDLLCESQGMASVAFGQQMDRRQARIDEVVESGVTYYAVEPSIDIAPFERLVVGLTPTSRQVFSIRLEKYVDSTELDQIVETFKVALSEAHSSVSWRVIGNHHYGEQLKDLDLTIYRIGDFVNGEPTNLLSYDCDSKPLLGVVLDEARKAKGGK